MTATAVRPLTHRLQDPMDAPSLRWGVIGAGWIADVFARSTLGHTRSTVQAIASRDAHRGNLYASKYNVPIVRFGDGAYERVVDDPDVDAIYIATPHALHRDHALLAINAGKPVLVEKAFTRNAAQARDVIEAARRQSVFCMEAMWTRFLPHMVEARRLIAEGAIGDIVHVSADFGGSPEYDPNDRNFNPELAGGALLDLGVYPINFIHDMLGAPSAPGDIKALGALAPTGVDLRETIVLNYPERRAMGTALSSFAADTARLATVSGTEGRIDFGHDYYGPAGFTLVRSGRRELAFTQQTRLGWQYQVAEVARCVRAGATESEIMPLDATLQVMEILDESRRQLGVRYPGE